MKFGDVATFDGAAFMVISQDNELDMTVIYLAYPDDDREVGKVFTEVLVEDLTWHV